jgi:hypothetical protein
MNENERQFQSELADAIVFAYEENEQDVEVSTFADQGVMTMNAGLVVRKADGSEFQLQIVQSEIARVYRRLT